LGLARVDARAVGHERDPRRLRLAALTQVGDGLANALERDPGIGELLDDLQDHEVLEGIQALGPRSPRLANAGGDEAGPCPVIELSIGDADRPADLGDAIALNFGHDSSVITGT